jgi:gluconate kinase
MEFLNKVFEQRDKPISDSSKKLYTRNLMKLNNDMPITNFNFLKEPKQILNMIKDYKPTTQRSYIIALCTVLKNSKHQNLYDMYFEIFFLILIINLRLEQKRVRNRWIIGYQMII